MRLFYVYSMPSVDGGVRYQVVEKSGCHGCKLKYKALKISNRIILDDISAVTSKDAANQFVEWKRKTSGS